MNYYTKKLIDNWRNVKFIPSTVITMQFKKFSKDFKKAILEQIENDFTLVKYKAEAFVICGFLKHKRTGQFVYFATSDVRYMNKGEGWMRILIGKAKDDHDFTGQENRYTYIQDFGENVRKIVETS